MQQPNTYFPAGAGEPLVPVSQLGQSVRSNFPRPMGRTQPPAQEFSSLWTQSSPLMPEQSRQTLTFVPIDQPSEAMEESVAEAADELNWEEEAPMTDESAVITVEAAPPMPPLAKKEELEMQEIRMLVSALQMRVEALEYEVAMFYDLGKQDDTKADEETKPEE